jgi:hypothetical protein
MLGPPEETRNPHRRCLGKTFAARATLDKAHMMESGFDFKNYFGLTQSFLLTKP